MLAFAVRREVSVRLEVWVWDGYLTSKGGIFILQQPPRRRRIHVFMYRQAGIPTPQSLLSGLWEVVARADHPAQAVTLLSGEE